MKVKIFASFLIFTLILFFPQVNAQSDSFKEVSHKSLQIRIDHEGNVNVIHQIRDSDEPRQLNFVNGTVSNLKLIDSADREELIDISDGIDSIVILPDQGQLFVKYDLKDVLVLKDNVWTLDFRYLQTTIFVLPEEIDLVFANQRSVFLDGKNAFTCHGCEILLEYSINEPKEIKQVNWADKEFLVEIKTFAEIESFDFNQPTKEISFKLNSSNQFVTTVIPLELLWEPYIVFLDGKEILFNEYANNKTHVWLNMRPESSGEITIIGTTVVPEFPIIAPLTVGFLIILIIPFMKKFNRH
ncbi:MAG: hypothetical protein ACRBB5_01160 [Nitrosopumilus sp.]